MTQNLLTATTVAVAPTAPLLAAVNDVFRATGHRHIVPILAHTKVTLTLDGRVNLTTTDYEVFVTRSVDATMSVAHAGNEPEFALLTVALKQALSKLDPKADVTFVDDDKHVVLTQGSRKVRLAKGAVEEFPEIPETPEIAHFVEGRDLTYIAKTVSLLVGKDDMLPVLTATKVTVAGNTLTGMSTDRFRLAVADIPNARSLGETETDGLVPNFHVIGTMFGDDEQVGIGARLGHGDRTEAMGFVGTHTKISVRTIDGEFPRLRSLIPTEPTTRATFDGPAFLKAIKFAEIATLRNEALAVHVKENEVTLVGGNEDQETSDSVPAELDGDILQTGFNPQFLTDIVKLFGKSPVTMSSTTGTKPSLFTSESHPYLTTLCMPRRNVG